MNLTRLTYCIPFKLYKVAEFIGGKGVSENFKTFGINIGDEILLKSVINGHGKLLVEHNSREFSLGQEIASKILLECIDNDITTLNKIKIGDLVEVTKMGAKGDVRFRLLDMGLVKGVPLKVIRVAPLGDPIEVLINEFNLSLRLEEAKNIEVKVLEINKSKNGNKKRWGMFWD